VIVSAEPEVAAHEGPVRVSVLVLTYNHAPFIAEALDSVLMQRTNFAWELIISEDCSTDGTREIVQDYRRRFPDRIRLLLSEKNLRRLEILGRGIRAARGDFIALLDGDDYWTDPEKLRLQVEYLDAHPECSTCFHNALAVYQDGTQPPREWVQPGQKEFLTIEDIWRGISITTCATVFRNRLYELPSWFDEMPIPILDWPLHILNAEHGVFGYIDRVMTAYRIHPGGEHSRLNELERFEKRYQFYRRMNRSMNYRCNALARNGLFYYFLEWAEEYRNRGDRRKAAFCLRRCLAGRPMRRSGYKRFLRVGRWLLVSSARAALFPEMSGGR
jgi:glycosyltransferase involved in cell wall biosynthesis